MADLILAVLLAVIIGSAGYYVIRAKKRGVKCIGCPNGCSCGTCCSAQKDASSEEDAKSSC